MLGLGSSVLHLSNSFPVQLSYHQVKPVWLAEIGTRTAEAWDGTSWRSIPSLSRAKVVSKFKTPTIINNH